MYYDINKTLSYNCLFNFIVGNRGGGKTFGFKEWAIRSFLKTGKEFVYVRRFKNEFHNNDSFFDDMYDFFPDVDFVVRGSDYYINGAKAGTAIALSTAKIMKSVAFPNVNKICFDEFILDKGVHHYLPDEVTSFLELYETIARTRNDVICFFLSNAITITNPYFLYWDISLPYNKTIARYDDMLIELVQNKEFIEAKKKTRFGKLVDGTQYGKYAIENTFLRDNKTFIQKKTQNSQIYFSFTVREKLYGVWIDYKSGYIYVSQDVDPYCRHCYALTNADHQPNTLFLRNPRNSVQFQFFVTQYLLGNVRFENQNIKNICNEVIRWTL